MVAFSKYFNPSFSSSVDWWCQFETFDGDIRYIGTTAWYTGNNTCTLPPNLKNPSVPQLRSHYVNCDTATQWNIIY